MVKITSSTLISKTFIRGSNSNNIDTFLDKKILGGEKQGWVFDIKDSYLYKFVILFLQNEWMKSLDKEVLGGEKHGRVLWY